nr:hypothetical protein [uncultured Mediterranean phage uvMED]
MAYIGTKPTVGNFQICDAISVVNGQAAYTMQVGSVNVIPQSANHMIVSLNGTIQKPNSSFTVANSVITFSSNLATGDVIDFIQILGDVLDLGVPSDATVTTAKLSNDAVTPPKTNFFNTDPGNAADLGMLHIKSTDTSSSVSTNADELVVEGTRSGMTFLAANNNYSYINFGDSGASDIGSIRYGHPNNDLKLYTSSTEAMSIDSAGHVTKPLQSAVHAYLSTTQSNISTGFTTVNLDAEIFDVNSDFNTSTYTFTAPVTGKYLVTMNLRLDDVDTAFQWIYLVGESSNRNYYLNVIDPRMLAQDGNWSWVGSSLVDMDANDTFLMRTRSSAHGAAQMDIAGGTATSTETTMTITLLS